MNASNATLLPVLGIDLGGVRGTVGVSETGGWTSENVATGTNTGYVQHGQQRQPGVQHLRYRMGCLRHPRLRFADVRAAVDTVNWTTRTTDGIHRFHVTGTSYHQEASDKARDILYVTTRPAQSTCST